VVAVGVGVRRVGIILVLNYIHILYFINITLLLSLTIFSLNSAFL
jgi:hypothetical protein